MTITEQTAVLALALQAQAVALWIDGQHDEALRVEGEARALLGLSATTHGAVLGSQRVSA